MNILFMGTFRCSKSIKTDMVMINTKSQTILREGGGGIWEWYEAFQLCNVLFWNKNICRKIGKLRLVWWIHWFNFSLHFEICLKYSSCKTKKTSPPVQYPSSYEAKNVFVLNWLAHFFQFGLPDVYGTPSMGLTMPGVVCGISRKVGRILPATVWAAAGHRLLSHSGLRD